MPRFLAALRRTFRLAPLPLLGLTLYALATSHGAWANGRFPAAGQLVVDPSDPDHILVRTTYGLIVTRDAGANWDWICEGAVGWSGQFDPPITITSDGTLVAGIYDGLSVGHGDACAWGRVEALEGHNVVDVSTERGDPRAAVVVVSDVLGADTFRTQVWASPDNAVTWSQAGVDLPEDLQALTLDVAPSDAQRIYVSGIQGGEDGVGVVARSVDRGERWEWFEIPGSDVDHAPYIAAVDPVDADVVYVRLSASPGVMVVSRDGGATWEEAFTGAGSLKGFALSPDGGTLLVGGDGDGIWGAPTASLVFSQVSAVRPQCLTWASSGVYACALEYNDGFTVGQSSDGGVSFVPVYYLACLRGPLACAQGSAVQGACEGAWPATADTIDQASCFGEEPTPTPVGTASPAATPTPETSEGGCGCGSGGAPERASTMGLGVLLLGLHRRRRAAAAGSHVRRGPPPA